MKTPYTPSTGPENPKASKQMHMTLSLGTLKKPLNPIEMGRK